MPEYAMWCELLCTVHPYKDPSEVFSGALHTFCNFMKILSKESKKIFRDMSKLPGPIQESDVVTYWVLATVRRQD